MPSIGEALGEQSQIKGALDAGVDQISIRQNVAFTLYTKVALAPDSSVFWVAGARVLNVTGALHYATDRLQNEDETVAQNHVLLSSEHEITEFNAVAPGTMWIGSWPLGEGDDLCLSVAFAGRGNFFGPAELYHYSGIAVYPALASQIVASEADLPTGPIVSNSLPIWLAMNAMAPVYPSFLVPDNIVPPYVVAHIDPNGTQALQAFGELIWPGKAIPNSGVAPFYELAWSQLMRDEVELILYGFTNQMAIQYLAALIDMSLTGALFGFANSPAIRDEKRTQVEIASLAQKKTIHVSANYNQATANAYAYRLILQALVSTVNILPV